MSKLISSQTSGLSRRQFATLAGAAALTATSGAGVPTPAAAAGAPLKTQAPGFQRRTVGDTEITALLDGYIDVPAGFWKGIDAKGIETSAKAAFLSNNGTIRIGVTSYVINTGTNTVLIDSGAAGAFGPTSKNFLDSLAAAGIAPQSIDTIIATHLHPDHILALVNDGKAVFANAALVLSSADLNFWTNDANAAKAPDFAKPWFGGAKTVAGAYKDRLKTVSGTADIVPGVSVFPLPGHTPGQMGVQVTSKNEEFLMIADAIGVASVQFAHPDAGLVFDVDSEAGRKTRKAILDRAATDRPLISASHLPFPTFGHVLRQGNAYAWQPAEWQFI